MRAIQAAADGLRKTFVYSGTATRAEFFFTVLLWLLAPQVFGFCVGVAYGTLWVFSTPWHGLSSAAPLPEWLGPSVGGLYVLLALPALSVAVRRLHAFGHSGRRVSWAPGLWLLAAIPVSLIVVMLGGVEPREAGKVTGYWMWRFLPLFLTLPGLFLLRSAAERPPTYDPN